MSEAAHAALALSPWNRATTWCGNTERLRSANRASARRRENMTIKPIELRNIGDVCRIMMPDLTIMEFRLISRSWWFKPVCTIVSALRIQEIAVFLGCWGFISRILKRGECQDFRVTTGPHATPWTRM